MLLIFNFIYLYSLSPSSYIENNWFSFINKTQNNHLFFKIPEALETQLQSLASLILVDGKISTFRSAKMSPIERSTSIKRIKTLLNQIPWKNFDFKKEIESILNNIDTPSLSPQKSLSQLIELQFSFLPIISKEMKETELLIKKHFKLPPFQDFSSHLKNIVSNLFFDHSCLLSLEKGDLIILKLLSQTCHPLHRKYFYIQISDSYFNRQKNIEFFFKAKIPFLIAPHIYSEIPLNPRVEISKVLYFIKNTRQFIEDRFFLQPQLPEYNLLTLLINQYMNHSRESNKKIMQDNINYIIQNIGPQESIRQSFLFAISISYEQKLSPILKLLIQEYQFKWKEPDQQKIIAMANQYFNQRFAHFIQQTHQLTPTLLSSYQGIPDKDFMPLSVSIQLNLLAFIFSKVPPTYHKLSDITNKSIQNQVVTVPWQYLDLESAQWHKRTLSLKVKSTNNWIICIKFKTKKEDQNTFLSELDSMNLLTHFSYFHKNFNFWQIPFGQSVIKKEELSQKVSSRYPQEIEDLCLIYLSKESIWNYAQNSSVFPVLPYSLLQQGFIYQQTGLILEESMNLIHDSKDNRGWTLLQHLLNYSFVGGFNFNLACSYPNIRQLGRVDTAHIWQPQSHNIQRSLTNFNNIHLFEKNVEFIVALMNPPLEALFLHIKSISESHLSFQSKREIESLKETMILFYSIYLAMVTQRSPQSLFNYIETNFSQLILQSAQQYAFLYGYDRALKKHNDTHIQEQFKQLFNKDIKSVVESPDYNPSDGRLTHILTSQVNHIFVFRHMIFHIEITRLCALLLIPDFEEKHRLPPFMESSKIEEDCHRLIEDIQKKNNFPHLMIPKFPWDTIKEELPKEITDLIFNQEIFSVKLQINHLMKYSWSA